MAVLRLRPPAGPPIEFEQERTLVGRDPSCTVVLDDKSVSRRHVIVERRGASWCVVDQGSANGTFVDGQQVAEAELRDGQELRLGTLPLAVEVESDMPQTVLMSSPELPPPPPTRPLGQASAAPARAAAAPPPPPPTAGDPRAEAARRLGLPATASAYDVSQRYAERAAELQAKLAAAPTPHLQATWERHLHELGQAAHVLAPGFSTGAATDADLPSAHPVLVPDDLGDSLMEPVRNVPLAEPARPVASGPSLVTTALGALIVLMLGASGYFWLSETRTGKDLATLAKSSDFTTAQAEWQKYQVVDQLEKEGALKNGAFKLCNRSAQPLQVAWLGAVYLEEPKDAGQTYTVKTYNSLLCRQEFKLVLPPGAETAVNLPSEQERCRWDGQGVFFALYVRRMVPAPAPARPGAPPREPEERTEYLSGLLNGRKDCVNIAEDW